MRPFKMSAIRAWKEPEGRSGDFPAAGPAEIKLGAARKIERNRTISRQFTMRCHAGMWEFCAIRTNGILAYGGADIPPQRANFLEVAGNIHVW